MTVASTASKSPTTLEGMTALEVYNLWIRGSFSAALEATITSAQLIALKKSLAAQSMFSDKMFVGRLTNAQLKSVVNSAIYDAPFITLLTDTQVRYLGDTTGIFLQTNFVRALTNAQLTALAGFPQVAPTSVLFGKSEFVTALGGAQLSGLANASMTNFLFARASFVQLIGAGQLALLADTAAGFFTGGYRPTFVPLLTTGQLQALWRRQEQKRYFHPILQRGMRKAYGHA